MESFGVIAVSLLSIKIILLFMIMKIQSNCSTKDNMTDIKNPHAQPRRIALGGIPISNNSVIDTPGIEDADSPDEKALLSMQGIEKMDSSVDLLSDPTKKKSLAERLTQDIQSNNNYSLASKDDEFESEMDQEKHRAGKTVYDVSNPQDGDPNFRLFKGANHFKLGDPSDTNTLNSRERLYNKTDGYLYQNHIKWNRGKDITNYRERLQMNRVDHMDPYPELDEERRPIVFDPIKKSEYAAGDQVDPVIDNVSIEFILSEPRSNLRY